MSIIRKNIIRNHFILFLLFSFCIWFYFGSLGYPGSGGEKAQLFNAKLTNQEDKGPFKLKAGI